VALETVGLEVKVPFPIEIEQGPIGGPSAGLMLALTVLDLADPADLARGRTIAGTGTIDLGGNVGRVGGVRQKVEAARKAGATIFLAPRAEAAEARAEAGDDMDVIAVRTIDDAVTALASPPLTPSGTAGC
jgi:PDZ domain-containing protein